MMQEVKHPGTEGPFNPRRETGGETRSPDGDPTRDRPGPVLCDWHNNGPAKLAAGTILYKAGDLRRG
jgi:hypothetical protein